MGSQPLLLCHIKSQMTIESLFSMKFARMILQAGLHAPSAGNNQRCRIVVCQDKEINEQPGRLSRHMYLKESDPAQKVQPVSAEPPSIRDDLTLMDGFYHAPTVLTIFSPKMKYTREDAAMIAENIQLAAHFLGVGACYMGTGGG